MQTPPPSAPVLPASTAGPNASSLIDPADSVRSNAYWAVLGLTVFLLLLPIWIPVYNTLVDYPFHLARAWMLYHYDQSQFLQAIFARSFDPIPNLAIDLTVPALLTFLPPLIAGKVFLSAIVVLFALGCHGVATGAYGRPSWMVPLAAFTVFSSDFLYGFVNCCFSLSLFLCTLALWIRFRRAWTLWRWLAVTILATVTYIAHLAGFVFLGMSIVILLLLDLRTTRRIRRGHAASLAVLIGGVAIQLIPWQNGVKAGGAIIWGTVAKKLLGFGAVFLGFHYALDAVAVLLLLAAVILASMRGKMRFHTGLLTLAIVFLFASFLSPTKLTAGGGDGADARFVPAGMVLLFLSCKVIGSRRVVRYAFLLAFAAMFLRFGEIAWTLMHTSRAAESQMAALREVKPHSRICAIFLRPKNHEEEKRMRANLHLPAYAVMINQSVSSDIYAKPGAQPLYFRNQAYWSVGQSPSVFDPAYLDRTLPRFDYFWGCRLDASYLNYIRSRATLVATGGVCELWKLHRAP